MKLKGDYEKAKKYYDAGCAALANGDLDEECREFESSIGAHLHFKAIELLGEAWLRKGEPMKAIVSSRSRYRAQRSGSSARFACRGAVNA